LKEKIIADIEQWIPDLHVISKEDQEYDDIYFDESKFTSTCSRDGSTRLDVA
jgi:hypothetical protein